MSDQQNDPCAGLQDRLAKTADEARAEAVAKRHARGWRTARENLADLTDGGVVSEYGQLAVAAQRTRREGDALYAETAADAVLGQGRASSCSPSQTGPSSTLQELTQVRLPPTRPPNWQRHLLETELRATRIISFISGNSQGS